VANPRLRAKADAALCQGDCFVARRAPRNDNDNLVIVIASEAKQSRASLVRIHKLSAAFDYDPATDSLYIKLRPGPSVDNRIISDDMVIDLGADGEAVGFDIQHASQHADLIAEALGYLHHNFAVEAHRQSLAAAASKQAKRDQDFIDAASGSAGE
jgi:uncharacterized protein YuzE